MLANEIHQLNKELLGQSFVNDTPDTDKLLECQQIAANYSRIENSLAVLSDFKENKSYLYCGGVAQRIGIGNKGEVKKINSIWEEELFNKIHPDDLLNKHILELQFFNFLKTIPVNERNDYYITSEMRIRDDFDNYIVINHRMFYVYSNQSGYLWLALCLYNNSPRKEIPANPDRQIINSSTGQLINIHSQNQHILSNREKEILDLVDNGKLSKEIAEILHISKNTVNRHRQNILEKLRVKNTHEAIRVAKQMNLL